MGRKERHFAPLINVSVEQLVPLDHFYRHLERTLDLTFVRVLPRFLRTCTLRGKKALSNII
jgi:hypothetical protein